jgi:hypothetical protein
MFDATPTIKLSAEDYMKIIAGKPILTSANSLQIGRRYKLINAQTKTHMFRYLDSILADWSYWK